MGDKATRRQKFVAAAQARRSWLATSNRIKAVLRFSSPVPHRFWGGQKLNAVMRFRRSVGRRSVGHISNVSFQHLPGLSTTEESASLPSIPREPSASGPPRSRRLAVPKKRHRGSGGIDLRVVDGKRNECCVHASARFSEEAK